MKKPSKWPEKDHLYDVQSSYLLASLKVAHLFLQHSMRHRPLDREQAPVLRITKKT